MPPHYNLPYSQQLLKANKQLFVQALKALAPTVREDRFWRRLVAEGHRQRVLVALRSLQAQLAWQPGDLLRSIAAPKLVLSGEYDMLTGGATAQRAAQALDTPLITLRGVGHSPLIEAPDRFVAHLVPFISLPHPR